MPTEPAAEELVEAVTVDAISENLYTSGQPDPDLVIRTSGEQRLSGFLLWQSAYSEMWFTEAHWPEFRRVDFLRALRDYSVRHRRYGDAEAACQHWSMAALSAVVFSLSWWLGLYLLARDPRKPVLALAAIGLCSFATAVALDAVRLVTHSALLGHVEIYLVAVPGVAWFAVLLELARPCDSGRAAPARCCWSAASRALTLVGATLAGSVDGPLRLGHVVMCVVISVSTLGAMVAALRRRAQHDPGGWAGHHVATLFFALANAILIIPLGVVPSWLALASTGCDVLGLGVAVALWDAFDEGQALRADMLRSFTGTGAVVALLGGQMLIGIALTRRQSTAQTALTVLLFTSLAIAASVQVLADPLAGLLDRLVFSRSPMLRAHRETLRRTQSALPLRLGRSARRFRRRHVRPADPPRAGPLRRPVQAGRQPADRAARHRRAAGRPRGARPAAGAGHRAQGSAGRPHRRGSNRATAATSAPPSSGATTTRCTSPTSSACAPTRRTPPPPAWTRPPGRPGSGSSPRCRSVRCTTGRTRRPG